MTLTPRLPHRPRYVQVRPATPHPCQMRDLEQPTHGPFLPEAQSRAVRGRSAGEVTLAMTSNDPDGCGACTAATSSLVVTINPAATVSAGGNQTICAGSTVSLTGTKGGSATTTTWTTSGTGIFANASAVS